jgi:hypothetical protein
MYKSKLEWLANFRSPAVNNLVSQLFNLPEMVWRAWCAEESLPPKEVLGKLSFLLDQLVLAPGQTIIQGVDHMVAWRHYRRYYRQDHPEPASIKTRIDQRATSNGHERSLTDALIWYWMLEIGYTVALPHNLCHQRIILGLHLVREHITLEDLKQRLYCDDHFLDRMLNGHVVLSTLGACMIMQLNNELAQAHPFIYSSGSD